MNQIYIISGPNGAGKSTSAYTILPKFLSINEFVNADEIAKGLSPLNSSTMRINLEAGKIMLNRIRNLMYEQQSFAFETTLSPRIFKKYIKKAKELGYEINLVFLWIKDSDFAKERVKIRVQQNGHSVAGDVIERRYKSGLKNLFNVYWDIVDHILIYSANTNPVEIVFEKKKNNTTIIHNDVLWQQIKSNYVK